MNRSSDIGKWSEPIASVRIISIHLLHNILCYVLVIQYLNKSCTSDLINLRISPWMKALEHCNIENNLFILKWHVTLKKRIEISRKAFWTNIYYFLNIYRYLKNHISSVSVWGAHHILIGCLDYKECRSNHYPTSYQ